MLMLGRGAVTDPGLGLAIKADMAGAALTPLPLLSPGISWAALLPLLGAFWQVVCSRLDSCSHAGRLKPINDPALAGEWLTVTLRAQRAAQLPESSIAQSAPLLIPA